MKKNFTRKFSFERIIRGLSRHPVLLALSLIISTAIAVLGIARISFEGSLETMLPGGSKALDTVTFLRDTELAGKVAVNVTAYGEEKGTSELVAEMRRLAAEFEKSHLIDQAVALPSGSDFMGEILFFTENSGQILDEDDLVSLRSRLNEDEVNRAIRSWYSRLSRPEGSFLVDLMRNDPLGISFLILDRLDDFSRSFGYRAEIENGQLIHPDGKHGLVLLDTVVAVTDTAGSRELTDYCMSVLSKMPAGFSGEMISGHLRSVSNEDVLRRDISITVAIASLAFLVLFLGIFKDPGAAVLFLLPGASVIFSLNISAMLLGSLSYLVIGFGAVMAGISVDYGIYVYVSLRHSHDPYIAVKRIIKPAIIGALTTLSVFAAFFVSAIPGYRQLAVFALISISLSIFAAVVFMPPLLHKSKYKTFSHKKTRNSGAENSRKRVFFALFFLISIPAAAALSGNLTVDTSLERLDGTEAAIAESEKSFRQLWTQDGTGQAIAVVSGETYEEASEKNESLYSELAKVIEGGSLSNMAMFWPSYKTRSQNLTNWKNFWDNRRIETTRIKIQTAAGSYGFSKDAFEPFFDMLNDPGSPVTRPYENAILSQLEERFVQEFDGGYRFLSFFPDTEAANTYAADITEDMASAFTVSPQALGMALSESIAAEVSRIALAAVIMIAVIMILLVRNIKLALAALLPAVTGVSWLLAIMAVSGTSLNVANMVAGIVVTGLCIDYGIFMAHGWESGPDSLTPISRAITLSAVSTLIGAGVLTLASHPALFSIGITIVTGVSAGYAAAILGVPGLCSMLSINKDSGIETAAQKQT